MADRRAAYISGFMIAYSTLTLGGIIVGSILVANGHSEIGWLLILVGLASEVIVGVWFVRARAPIEQRESAVAHGPGSRAPVANGVAKTGKWYGTASIPTAIGYIDLAGLGVLEIAGDRLAIRGRGEMITDVAHSTIYRAYRLGQRGVEVRRAGHQSYYFWTRRWEEVVASLIAAGFDVSNQEVRFSGR